MRPSTLRQALRDRLVRAMRERDRETVSALRSAIAALENAEAVPVTGSGGLGAGGGRLTGGAPGTSEHVALAASGLGAAEADRLELDDAREAALMRAEIDGLHEAAGLHDSVGQRERAAAARAAASELAEVVHSALGTSWGQPRS